MFVDRSFGVVKAKDSLPEYMKNYRKSMRKGETCNRKMDTSYLRNHLKICLINVKRCVSCYSWKFRLK